MRCGENIELNLVYSVTSAATGVLDLSFANVLGVLGLASAPNTAQPIKVTALQAGTTYWDGLWFGNFYGPNGQYAWATTAPYTWKNGDAIHIQGSLPIAQWIGSGTVGLVQGYEEYASNSDVTATASVTASGFLQGFGNFGGFGSGWAVGTFWTRRVRFQQPVQWGRDELSIGIVSGGFIYDDATKRGYIQTYQSQGTNEYGTVFKAVSGDPYAVDVVFCQGGRITTGMGYTYNGDPFSALAGSQWFVKKTSAGKPGESATGKVIPYSNNGVATQEYMDFGGGIIEVGSNANGSWKKYADGTIEVRGIVLTSDAPVTNGTFTFNFPITFYNDWSTGLVVTPVFTSNAGYMPTWYINNAYPSTTQLVITYSTGGSLTRCTYVAHGRWRA